MIRLLAVVAVLAVAAVLAPGPAARAESALIVGPTRLDNYWPFSWLNLWDWKTQEPLLAEHYYSSDGVDRTIVSYPGSIWPATGFFTPTMGGSVATGVEALDETIRSTDGPITVVGHSQGTLVLDAEMARLANDPTAPPPEDLTFIMSGAPQHGSGILTLFPSGLYIPILDITVARPVESQYDTVVIIGEYDLAGDFPDRPWNLVAVANALAGMVYVHDEAPFSDPADVAPEDKTIRTNSKGATVTTYLVRAKQLPMTRPLRAVGVPDFIVDLLDSVLRPIVDFGYSRNDPKPPQPSTPSPASTNEPAPEVSAAATVTPAPTRRSHAAQDDPDEAGPTTRARVKSRSAARGEAAVDSRHRNAGATARPDAQSDRTGSAGDTDGQASDRADNDGVDRSTPNTPSANSVTGQPGNNGASAVAERQLAAD